MIDKVQKILSKITTRKLCTMDEHMAFYNDKAKEDYMFLSEIEELIKALQKEPVSEELEEAAKSYSNNLDNICGSIGKQTRNAFKAGAKWQKQKDSIVSENLKEASKEWLAPQLDKSYANYGEAKMMELTHFDGYAMLDAIEFGAKWKAEQFEKNRLAACDKQTEEEAEVERDFVMGIIENEHRQPTFDDAIKYGMRLHKEQMMANTADAMIGLPYENKDGGYTQLIDVSRPLPVGNNKIAIIFKED